MGIPHAPPSLTSAAWLLRVRNETQTYFGYALVIIRASPACAAMTESERQFFLLRDELPHDLRHMLGGVHPAIAGAAADPAGVAVHVLVRIHESPKDVRGTGCDAGYEGQNNRGGCRCVCVLCVCSCVRACV